MAILKCPVSGCGTNPPIHVLDNVDVGGIAVDETSVYATILDATNGAVVKITPK